MSLACAQRQNPDPDPGMADAVLREVLALLKVFADSGETAAIDLGGLPLSPRDREELDSVLGRGDIAATMDLAGRSEVWETGFSGVWRVRHFGASEIIVDLIEIASCPEILRSDRRDASLSAQRLSQLLEQKKSAVAETSHEQ